MLTVIAAVDGPAPATHLIRHRDGPMQSFFLATLRSYRLVIELLDPLARRRSARRVVARFEVTGADVSPDPGALLGELEEASEAISGDTFAERLDELRPEELIPLSTKRRGAAFGFRLTRPIQLRSSEVHPGGKQDSDQSENDFKAEWILTLFALPYRPSATQMRELECSTSWRRCVWYRTWDGCPGLSGFEEVLRVDGRFFYRDDNGFRQGPLSSLPDAMEPMDPEMESITED